MEAVAAVAVMVPAIQKTGSDSGSKKDNNDNNNN
jgi:hypothetical protein